MNASSRYFNSAPSAVTLLFGVSVVIGIVSFATVTTKVAAALPLAVDGQPLPSLAPMLERATPAVVNIAASGTPAKPQDPFFSDPIYQRFFNIPKQRRQRQKRSVGSGVIIDATRGMVVTNHHVIAGTKAVTVTLRDGRTLDAKLVGSDPATDLAVLMIPPQRLTDMRFANSDALRVGDFVVAIGNPFGLGQTVTSGIVSALGRDGLGLGNYEDFIQTDAAINSGNSGGALVNLRGELIGINSQIFSRGGGSIGIGFAIPTNMVRDIVAQLVEHGAVHRGLLGVASQDLTLELAEAFGLPPQRGGAVVTEIQPGSPAQFAGLQPGDLVIGINDRPIRRAQELKNALGVLAVGDEVRVQIVREGRERTVSTKIGKRVPPAAPAAPTLAERLDGAQFSDLADEQSTDAANGAAENDAIGSQGADVQINDGDAVTKQGVLVAEVDVGSAAWRYGLRKDDVVVAVNRKPIRDLDELKKAVSSSGPALMLKTQRGSGSVFILIQ